MTIRRTLEITAFCAALLLAALLFRSWLEAHDDQLRLQATLASQKQILDAADARERDRNASLKDALAQIDALKRAAQNQTPAQLARALQDALQLPQPITITPPVGQASACPNASNSKSAECMPPARQQDLFDALFHRFSPRTPADANANSSPPQFPPPPNTTVGERHGAPEVADSTATPLSSNDRPPAVRTAGVSPVPLPASTSQRQYAQDSLQGTDATSRSVPPQSSAAQSTTLQSATQSASAAPRSAQPYPAELSAAAEIPAADLAPLYDYIQDCRACQLQLAASKQNATDDAAKIAALTRERDAALTAAKGGSFWLRLKRNAHWLAVGAAIGAVTSTAALCSTGHCR
jgi:hypothetical protein